MAVRSLLARHPAGPWRSWAADLVPAWARLFTPPNLVA
jgi:hypothetical protein